MHSIVDTGVDSFRRFRIRVACPLTNLLSLMSR